MNWNRAEGCYYNDISIKQIRKILQKIGLNENQFTIKSQKSGQNTFFFAQNLRFLCQYVHRKFKAV